MASFSLLIWNDWHIIDSKYCIIVTVLASLQECLVQVFYALSTALLLLF